MAAEKPRGAKTLTAQPTHGDAASAMWLPSDTPKSLRSSSKRSFPQPATLTPTDGSVFPHKAAQEGRRGPGRAQRGGSAAPSRRGAPGRCEGRDRGRDRERRFGGARRGRGREGSGIGPGRAVPGQAAPLTLFVCAGSAIRPPPPPPEAN